MSDADNRLIKALIAEKCNIAEIVKNIDITFKENLYEEMEEVLNLVKERNEKLKLMK